MLVVIDTNVLLAIIPSKSKYHFVYEQLKENKFESSCKSHFMRLKVEEAKFIKQIAEDCFGKETKIYLFGSRALDDNKGGDIDLYIETKTSDHIFDKKLKMLKALYNKMGEQKIDIVINNFTSSLYIYEVAQQEGILL